jgi:uncharacterized protein YggE
MNLAYSSRKLTCTVGLQLSMLFLKSVYIFMKNVNLTVIIVAILIMFGLLAGIYLLKNDSNNTVSASGNYEMSVAPDQVLVYLLIETRSKSAEEAKELLV